jgi:hypothetical protein
MPFIASHSPYTSFSRPLFSGRPWSSGNNSSDITTIRASSNQQEGTPRPESPTLGKPLPASNDTSTIRPSSSVISLTQYGTEDNPRPDSPTIPNTIPNSPHVGDSPAAPSVRPTRRPNLTHGRNRSATVLTKDTKGGQVVLKTTEGEVLFHPDLYRAKKADESPPFPLINRRNTTDTAYSVNTTAPLASEPITPSGSPTGGLKRRKSQILMNLLSRTRTS